MSDCVWQYRSDTVWDEDPDKLTVYLTSATEPEILILAGSAAIIWKSLPGLSTHSLVAELATTFKMAVETIQPDVEAVIADLQSKGLIHAVPA